MEFVRFNKSAQPYVNLTNNGMQRIQILLFDGFDELDAIGPFEVLRRAARESDLYVELVSADGPAEIEAAFGLRIFVEGQLNLSHPPDVLLVPGGGWNSRASQGAWTEFERGRIPKLIASVYQAGTIIASVCTGAMLLAKAGILTGRSATTHHAAREELQKFGVRVTDARVQDDGDVITGGGVTSGIDIAFHLVDRFAGGDLAPLIARQMEYRWQKAGKKSNEETA